MSGGEVDYRRLTNLGTARYRVEESAGRIRKRRELIIPDKRIPTFVDGRS